MHGPIAEAHHMRTPYLQSLADVACATGVFYIAGLVENCEAVSDLLWFGSGKRFFVTTARALLSVLGNMTVMMLSCHANV